MTKRSYGTDSIATDGVDVKEGERTLRSYFMK